MLVDSHCHLDFPELQRDLAGVLGTGLPVWCQGAAAPASVAGLTADGIASRAVPLWMRDADTSATLAGDAIALAQNLR